MVRTIKEEKDIVKILKLKHTSIRARGRSSSIARSNHNAVRCSSSMHYLWKKHSFNLIFLGCFVSSLFSTMPWLPCTKRERTVYWSLVFCVVTYIYSVRSTPPPCLFSYLSLNFLRWEESTHTPSPSHHHDGIFSHPHIILKYNITLIPLNRQPNRQSQRTNTCQPQECISHRISIRYTSDYTLPGDKFLEQHHHKCHLRYAAVPNFGILLETPWSTTLVEIPLTFEESCCGGCCSSSYRSKWCGWLCGCGGWISVEMIGRRLQEWRHGRWRHEGIGGQNHQ